METKKEHVVNAFIKDARDELFSASLKALLYAFAKVVGYSGSWNKRSIIINKFFEKNKIHLIHWSLFEILCKFHEFLKVEIK